MISLCMIVKNEGRQIARCLKSVQAGVDEIIVVDTGSTDNTVNIAKKFGAKVFYYPWHDDFAAARNFSLEKASGDWILYLDADEELQLESREQLQRLTRNNNVEAYYFHIQNLHDRQHSLSHINVRMFRNRKEYRFQGRLHEQILDSILEHAPKGRQCVADSQMYIIHYGYVTAEFLGKNKAARNYRIIKKMLADKPEDPYYLYHMGNCLVNLGDIKHAAKYYRAAVENLPLGAAYAPSVFISLVTCMLQLGRLVEASKYLELGKRIYPDYTDIYYLEGQFYFKLGHLEKSKQCFQQCLALGEQTNSNYTTRTGVGSFLPLFQLAQIYQNMGALDKAIECQIKGLNIKNNSLNDWLVLAKLIKQYCNDLTLTFYVLKQIVRHEDPVAEKLILARLLSEIEAYQFVEQILVELPDTDETRYLKGIAALKTSRYGQAIEHLKKIDEPVGKKELIIAHWLSTPAADAANFIQDSNLGSSKACRIYQCINDILIHNKFYVDLPVTDRHFQETINYLLTLQQPQLVLDILAGCGIFTSPAIVEFLLTDPTAARLELAAKVALYELKESGLNAEYLYALARYFMFHQELDTALKLAEKIIELQPQKAAYQKLRYKIYCLHSLNMVWEALKHYPNSTRLNNFLIALQQKLTSSLA